MDPSARFVGRDRQLRLLRAALERGLSGDVPLVLVVGEAGIGKSTLVDRVAVDARERGARVVRGAADDGDASSLGLWRGVHRALGLPDGTIDPALPPAERRWEQLAALADALAAAGPVLVVLEDVHWADEPSTWVLDRLPRELAGSPVTLVATQRTGESANVPALRPTEVIAVDGLDDAEVARLLATLHAPAGLDVAAVRERAGGNPLFVREIVQLGLTTGVPPSVSDVLARSLDRLDPSVRNVLATWAAAGPDVPAAVVARATGRSPRQLRETLDAAVEIGVLVEAPDGAPRFRHALFAEAALASCPAGDRRLIHRSLAAAWEAVGDGGPAAGAATARHRLAAVPLEDAAAAGETALLAASGLTGTGDLAGAAALLGHADAVVAAHVTAPGLRARLLVDLGETHFVLGDVVRSLDAFERGAELAAGLDDPELLAAAESGAARHVQFFVMDPVRQRRLAAADAALPAGDHPLRVALLGCRAVLGRADPEAAATARRLGDEALAMARRLGDGELVATALADRYFAAGGTEDLHARHAASAELIALGDRLRRPDLTMLGQEWRFADRLHDGDLDGARDALARLEATAAVMPSAAWRYTAMLRRVVVHDLEGDHGAALGMIAAAAAVGRTVHPDHEVRGLEYHLRLVTALLWGGADPALEELHVEVVERQASVPSAFIQIPVAACSMLLGDVERARTIVGRFTGRLDQVVSGIEGMAMLQHLGALVADLGSVAGAVEIRRRLEPCAGKFLVGNGLGFELPVDTLRGRLGLLLGDPDTAVGELERGAALARRLPSPPLLARCLHHLAAGLAVTGDPRASATAAEAADLAARIGLVLGPPATAPTTTTTTTTTAPAPAPAPASSPGRGPDGAASVVWRRRGDRWHIEWAHGAGDVACSTGMDQLRRLVTAPGTEITARELAWGSDAPTTDGDLGPALDARAKREYRARLLDLRAEIDEADEAADLERAARARLELDALMEELRRAVGLAGRDRPQGSAAERARVNVTRSLRRAIAAIGDSVPGLGTHLAVSVRTGRYCSYRPDPAAALHWDIDG